LFSLQSSKSMSGMNIQKMAFSTNLSTIASTMQWSQICDWISTLHKRIQKSIFVASRDGWERKNMHSKLKEHETDTKCTGFLVLCRSTKNELFGGFHSTRILYIPSAQTSKYLSAPGSFLFTLASNAHPRDNKVDAAQKDTYSVNTISNINTEMSEKVQRRQPFQNRFFPLKRQDCSNAVYLHSIGAHVIFCFGFSELMISSNAHKVRTANYFTLGHGVYAAGPVKHIGSANTLAANSKRQLSPQNAKQAPETQSLTQASSSVKSKKCMKVLTKEEDDTFLLNELEVFSVCDAI